MHLCWKFQIFSKMSFNSMFKLLDFCLQMISLASLNFHFLSNWTHQLDNVIKVWILSTVMVNSIILLNIKVKVLFTRKTSLLTCPKSVSSAPLDWPICNFIWPHVYFIQIFLTFFRGFTLFSFLLLCKFLERLINFILTYLVLIFLKMHSI